MPTPDDPLDAARLVRDRAALLDYFPALLNWLESYLERNGRDADPFARTLQERAQTLLARMKGE